MKISKLHYITQDNVPGFSHAALAEQACAGGADWVQLRVKNQTDKIWRAFALEVQEICRKSGAKLIINDYVALAKEIQADGVHLGKNDMSPAAARKILGNDFIIGGTANTFSDIENLANAGADYIGLGPFRFTATKENLSPVLGAEGLKSILSQCRQKYIRIPVIAIGGIKPGDVADILDAGASGVAISSVVNLHENKAGTIRMFNKLLNDHKEKIISE